ncbi:hypothetical protein HID58_061475 [Brassica napus]|uniref:Uncharacterized protein n=1 Tax=Brassica napus TaxID=3708 RepID=A0ABQ7ZYN3_BRANA|nr:hypothetical protein HID58_061475 [Brassica napus]
MSCIPQCHIGDTLPTLKTPTAGSVEQRVVPLPHLPSMVMLRKLNPSHYLKLIATGETQCSVHTNVHLMLFQLLKDVQPAQTHSLRILIQS